MKALTQAFRVIFLTILVSIILFPVFYIVFHSLKGQALISYLYEVPQVNSWHKLLPKPLYLNLDQYYQILFRSPKFLRLFWNSFGVVMPIIILQTLLSIFAAYGFSKVKFPGSETLFFIYIIIMLMPFQVTLVPNFIVLQKLNLLDSYGALILPGAFGTFGVFFLKQFMEGIDQSFIEEASLVGANGLQLIAYIITPMCKPIITSVVVLLFIDDWSMIDQPLIFISSESKYLLSTYLSTIANNNIGIGFACSVLYMILPIFFVLYAQSDLSDGLKITSLK